MTIERCIGATRRLGGLLLVPLLVAGALAQPGPWARTETREPCANFDPLRQPYFGDTHVHTVYSSDAVFVGTRDNPRGAYQFALGQPIGLAPFDAQGIATRTAQLRRPLDFTAVTDHAEQFGEMQICLTPGLTGYDSPECVNARTQLATTPPALPSLLPPLSVVQFLLGYGVITPPTRFAWCGPDGANCLGQASLVWEDTQAAAEQYYDRTAACGFTTFVAYEWSGQPGGNNLHRNVIFRNDVVPALPTSYMEQPTPDGLWSTLTAQCLNGLPGCDVLAIPHNANVSGGLMFAPLNSDGTPLTAASAAARAAREPLVELTQHKGDSECRPGVQSTDEVCGFEKINRLQLFSAISDPTQTFPPLNYVRNALREGLEQEQILGVNPFKLGLVGSTDTHNATAGNTKEEGWIGIQGQDDASPARLISESMRNNPGGLTVVWAEENSRDAIFSALQRRETYATSGTRPIVRFFGGDLSGVACGKADFVERAYATGTPMGGDLGPVRGKKSPRFAVWAMKDPQGTDLQRVQIVKGWADADGTTHDQTFDVAGNAANGAGVDPATCAPTGTGAADLCAIWTDPDFDPSQHAFYYARVVENPTCRWSTHICKQAGVDPFAADCAAQAAAAPPDFAACCLGKTNDAFLDPTIQERAWTSPIWYRPEAMAKVHARAKFGKRPGSDSVVLRATLGGLPPDFDPVANGLTLRVSNGDDLLALVAAPGAVRHKGRRFVFKDGSPAALSLTARKGEAVLSVRASSRDLAAVARADQIVTVSLASGLFRASQTRMWTGSARQLAFGGR